IALVQAGHMGFAVVAVLASVLTLWYYLLIQRKAFFGKLDERWKDVKEAPFWMLASNVILALLCVGIGIFFSLTIKTWVRPAADALSQGVRLAFGSWGM
ncbi:MAG: hypothetical protein MUP28_04605, partial [Candidatus Aminicenantes bacterium]|nr:hypothetical protein [Candidatus Aminicenantes bacterium]